MKLIIIMLFSLLTACATKPPIDAVAKRISPNYEALGNSDGIRVYAYGNYTLIKYKNQLAYISAYDSTGDRIELDSVGEFYRSEYLLNKFELNVNGRTVYISRIIEPTVNLSKAIPESNPGLDIKPDLQTFPELENYSKKQILDIQRFIDKASTSKDTTGESLFHAQVHQTKLKKSLEEHNPIVMVHFNSGASRFKPQKDLINILLESAQTASEIHLRGRTDSKRASKRDPIIAYYRASKARNYLVKNGIDPSIITINSLPEGDFAVPHSTRKGKAINRRVEIELRR